MAFSEAFGVARKKLGPSHFITLKLEAKLAYSMILTSMRRSDQEAQKDEGKQRLHGVVLSMEKELGALHPMTVEFRQAFLSVVSTSHII